MDSNYSLRVLMLPWLAHGHVSPFLELAKRLTCSSSSSSSSNILVYFCSTPINLSSIKDHLNNNSKFPSIKLVELHLPTLPGLPPHLHTTKYLPPHLMPTLKEAFDLAEPSFRCLLQTLNPDLLIYDFLQPWAPLAAHHHNIPAIQFLAPGAVSTSFFYHYLKSRPTEEYPFAAIRLGATKALEDDLEFSEILMKSLANAFSDADRLLKCLDQSSTFIAIKSFREIESKYIDYLSFLTGKEIIPVGPLVPDDDDDDDLVPFTDWLSRKERSSVVFVSFGSEYFMSEEEMEEIAHGLELSTVSFIWVVRFPNDQEGGVLMGADVDISRAKALPFGFLERVGGEKGMVVEGWAPQRKILAHPSVGGFLTHCGWSSVMEGMRFGVPMIALPLHLDQPLNAKLVVELGVGVEIQRERPVGSGRFRREEVAEGIRDVMVNKRGEDVRRKAREMAETMGRKGNEEDIQVLAKKMTHLCRRQKIQEN